MEGCFFTFLFLTTGGNYAEGLQTLNEWLGQITDVAKTLVVIGIIVGILFDDFFGVIAGLGRIMSQFGDAGFAGILSLAILVMWYDNKK